MLLFLRLASRAFRHWAMFIPVYALCYLTLALRKELRRASTFPASNLVPPFPSHSHTLSTPTTQTTWAGTQG